MPVKNREFVPFADALIAHFQGLTKYGINPLRVFDDHTEIFISYLEKIKGFDPIFFKYYSYIFSIHFSGMR